LSQAEIEEQLLQLGIQMDNIGDLSSIKKDKREEGIQTNGID
jgi:hypothetical protein